MPPSSEQVAAADAFFTTHLPLKTWTGTEWRSKPHSIEAYQVPEVAFLGRSNSGKSSLLNAITRDNSLCYVGAKPGKTKTLHAWAFSPIDPKTGGAPRRFRGGTEQKLVLLDMPGYGYGSHGDWGQDAMKYLTSRRQLRRAFVLLNPWHGLKDKDLQMLELLRANGIPHQIIATKCDTGSLNQVPEMLQRMSENVASARGRGRHGPALMTINDILAVGGLGDGASNRGFDFDTVLGVGDVRWAILRAAGLEDYAMTVLANGGKLSKPKPRSTTVARLSSRQKDQATKQAVQKQVAPIDDSLFPWGAKPEPEEAKLVVKPPHVGIGIEELLSMTASPTKSSKATSRPDESKGAAADVRKPMTLRERRRAMARRDGKFTS